MKSVGLRAVSITMVVAFAITFSSRIWWASEDGRAANISSAPIDNGGSTAIDPQATAEQLASIDVDVASASIDEIRERLDSLKSLYPPSRRELMRRLLIGRWLQLDPDGAFAWCRDDWEQHPLSGNIVTLLRQWSELDAGAAFSAWQSLPEGAKRNRVIPGLLWGLMKQGPETYLRYLEKFPPDSVRFPAGVATMFTELAQGDRGSAMARVSTLPENLRAHAYAGIASTWIKQNPSGAVEWVRDMPGGGTRDSVLKSILKSDWAHDHPHEAGALLQLLASTSGLESNGAVRSIFRKLMDADPVAAGQWAIKHLGANDHYELLITEELLPHTARDAPDELASLVTSLSDLVGDAGAAESWFLELGNIESGHSEMFTALAGIDDTTTRLAALNGLIESGNWNFDAAELALDSLPASDRAALIPSLAYAPLPGLDDEAQWARLSDYGNQIPEGEQRNAYRANLIESLVSWFSRWEDFQPGKAAELLATYPEAARDETTSDLITDIAGTWFDQSDGDTGELMNWTNGLDDPAQREQAWTTVARRFAKSNPTAASEWIGTLPPDDPARDATVAAFAETIVSEDPDAALIWAQSIGITAVREAALHSVIDQITWNDPTAARQALAKAPIDDAVRRELLNRIDHP